MAEQTPQSPEGAQRRGWFADWDNDTTSDYGWQPCFETGYGHIPCFEVWFKSKAECEQWIADNVIGVGWLSGEVGEADHPRLPPTSETAAATDPERDRGQGLGERDGEVDRG